MKSLVYDKALGGRNGLIGTIIVALILLVIFPLIFDLFRLNNVGRFLSLAFAAVGLVLCWGYGGILSLGQGVFWGLGGYCMAAFLKLEAAQVIANEAGTDQINALTTVGLPDFMDWNQVTELPWFWYPFKSMPLSMILIFLVPTVLAYLLGVAMFKRRVAGVYFAIITQALCWVMEILFVTRQGWTGGINGITDLRTFMGWDFQAQTWYGQYMVYYITAILLLCCVFIGRLVLASKFGKLLVAMRDTEDRVRFSGYDTSNLKVFIFCLAAAISALGGALFVMNFGFMSPKLVTIVPSIDMVIFCAVGGRLSLLGAIYGTLLVSFGRMYFSEEYPELWLFLMGALFICVTMFFPRGLAGIVDDYGPWLINKATGMAGKRKGAGSGAVPGAAASSP
ncbi:MAG: urea ABC transporter permease subunit UrtC [Planctomycetota bacterium]